MKKTILFLALIASALVYSQDFNVAIKVGAGSSDYDFDDLEYVNPETNTAVRIRDIGSIFSYNIGGYARYNFGVLPLGVRLGLQYTNLGGKVEVFEHATNFNRHITERNHRLDIPLTLTGNIKWFRVLAGVTYAIDIGRSQEVRNYLDDTFVQTGRFDFVVNSPSQNYWTYSLGLGADFNTWAIDILWEDPLSQDISGSREAGVFNFGPNAKQVTINLSFLILNKD
jgi:hypothetical protein